MTNERRDLLRWAVLVVCGLALTWAALDTGAQRGAAGAPFVGRYRLAVGPTSLLAPVIAVALLTAAARGWFDRASWPVVRLTGYGIALGWALALALVDGPGGLTRALLSTDSYFSDVTDV